MQFASRLFQRFINNIFSDITVREIALPYVDDLVIPAKNEKEAVARLKMVLKRAEEYGLEVNKKKCQLFRATHRILGTRDGSGEGGRLYPSLKRQKTNRFKVS